MTMHTHLFDFAKAYQEDLREQASAYRFSQRFTPTQTATRDRLLTGLGDALISLGEVVKSWRTCPDLGRCTEASQSRA